MTDQKNKPASIGAASKIGILLSAIGLAVGGFAQALAKNAGPVGLQRDCRSDPAAMQALMDPAFASFASSVLNRRELDRTVENMPRIRQNFKESNAEMRAGHKPQPPSDVTMDEIEIPGPDGAPPIRALLYKAPGHKDARPALLDIHGGGYTIGLPEMNDYRNRFLAKDLGAVIVSIDYRLAPEHPFPAAADDAYASLAWMHDNAKMLGIDPKKIAVSGDSAGGAIAGGLAVRARDQGEYPIALTVLIYPGLDDRAGTDLDPTCKPGTAAPWPGARKAYLRDVARPDNVSPYAFPARAQSLAGLPPTFVALGALDAGQVPALALAQRLMSEHVATELHVYPGAPHGFDYVPNAQASKRFYDDLRHALQTAWE
ncbi:MAG: alpha/beta hydrolase [Amphiplicatus sp.]